MQNMCKFHSVVLGLKVTPFFPQGSAAAPIARSVLEFFLDFDIPLYELYGMSESTGPQTLSLIGVIHEGGPWVHTLGCRGGASFAISLWFGQHLNH